MGSSSSSVHASGTFLTACDYENGYGWEMAEEESSSDESEGVQDNESHDPFMSVGTEDYNPPPNVFYTYTDFDAVKQRHYDMKEKYVKYLHTYMGEEIPRSIQHASELSEKELKDNGGHDQNHKYIIDPYIIAEMESRGSVQRVNQHKKDMVNSIKTDVAHKNKALAYRHGVHGVMTLPCATFMDDKPSQYHNTIEYIGVETDKYGSRAKQLLEKQRLDAEFDNEEVEDSATVLEFRKHFEGRRKVALRAERRKSSWVQRYRLWKQALRERFINYDYE